MNQPCVNMEEMKSSEAHILETFTYTISLKTGNVVVQTHKYLDWFQGVVSLMYWSIVEYVGKTHQLQVLHQQ